MSVCLLNSYRVMIRVMALNDTCNNISVISWRSVLLVEETGVPGENTDLRIHNVSGDKHR